MDILSVVVLAFSTGGVASAIFEFIRHRNAEKQLVKVIKRDQSQDEAMRQLLQYAREHLTSAHPDPSAIAAMAELLAEVSSKLSDSNRKDILDTLAQGSDKSKANYLVKIIDEVKSAEPQLS